MFLSPIHKQQRWTPLLRTPIAVALLALGSILVTPVSPVSAETIYKSVDQNGNTIFTDRPLEGAEKHSGGESDNAATNSSNDENAENEGPVDDDYDEPKKGLALAPEPKNPPKSDYQESSDPTDSLPVTVVEILSPVHDTTLHDPVGVIWVELQSYPTSLKETNLTAELWMDDQLVTSGKRPMLSLPIPERGTHVLVVKLVDNKGKLFLASEPTHIHVKYRVSSQ